MSHPIQPLSLDENGSLRFKANAIVRYILARTPYDLDRLQQLEFPQEDWDQFMQLLGYSLSDYRKLTFVSGDDGKSNFVSDESYKAAAAMAQNAVKASGRIGLLQIREVQAALLRRLDTALKVEREEKRQA